MVAPIDDVIVFVIVVVDVVVISVVDVFLWLFVEIDFQWIKESELAKSASI